MEEKEDGDGDLSGRESKIIALQNSQIPLNSMLPRPSSSPTHLQSGKGIVGAWKQDVPASLPTPVGGPVEGTRMGWEGENSALEGCFC